ncbi:MAG: DUF3458 domain-containing protein, partial [Sulfurovaceae bacterium]
YTATVYEKGAEVIRMIHTMLGEENYRKATDLYFETFDGQAVTTDDFLWAMNKHGDFDLEHFKLWYDQSGTPTLKVDESFENETYSLTLTQKIPNKVDGESQNAMYFPLKISLLDQDGSEVLEKMLIISKEVQTFNFDGLKTKPTLSINRDFSAPIIVEHTGVDYPLALGGQLTSKQNHSGSQRTTKVATSARWSVLYPGGIYTSRAKSSVFKQNYTSRIWL